MIAPIASGESLDEQQLVRDVLATNPMLKAAAAKWAAARERVPQAKAWEDPMVGVDFERMGTTRFGTYSDSEWMVSQTLPLTGKNLSRARASEAEARAAYEDVRRARLEVIAMARASYYRLANAHAQLAINRQNRDLFDRGLAISNAKLSVGKAAQVDVLATETDIQKIDVEYAGLEQVLSEQQTALNVLMNRPASSSLGRPAALAFRALGWRPVTLETRVLAQRPEIAAAEQRVKAEEARLQLARKQWIPDPQVRVEARHFRGSGSTFTEYDTGVFFSVPWVNPGKYSAGVREAQQMVEAMQRELDGQRTAALGKLRDQLRKIETLRRQYELSRDKLVPLARKAAETIRVNYQADKAGYIELLTTQRMLRESEAGASTQLADYLAALAEVESLVGFDPTAAAPAKAVVPHKKGR